MKIKLNKKVILPIIAISVVIILFGIKYVLYSPSPINRYIASNIYKTPANPTFKDDNFYQCVVDAYNEDNHTSVAYTTNLTDSQLRDIYNLGCLNEGIINLSGLAKLTSLEALHISNTQITSLNLRSAPNLVKLDVSNNQLTSIDVSQNPELKSLFTTGNRLKSIDVSQNPNLEILYVKDNQLTNLDISKNYKLGMLNAENNQLTVINVKGASSLYSLNVINNQLTNLNISDIPILLTISALRNPLKSITLNNLPNLKNLFFQGEELTSLNINGATALDRLNVSNSKLTSLNLGGIPNLVSFNASNSQLKNLDVTLNSNLSQLVVPNSQLTSLDVSKNSKLEKLNVSNSQLTTLDIRNKPKLSELIILNNPLTSVNIINVPNLNSLAFQEHELTSLTISGATILNHIHVHNSQITSLTISDVPKLVTLDVSNTQLTSLNINEATILESLDVSNNQLTSLNLGGAPNLVRLDASNSQLTSLDVNQNSNLSELDVSNNQLTSLDVSHNPNLSELNASSNQIRSIDVSKNLNLIDLMINTNQLTKLDLSKNTKLKEETIALHDNPYKPEKSDYYIWVNTPISITKAVKLPSHFTPDITVTTSENLSKIQENQYITTLPGTNYININTRLKSGSTYTDSYQVEVMDIHSDKYIIDKTSNIIRVYGDSDEEILSNIQVENGQLLIQGNDLIIKHEDVEVEIFRLIRYSISSSKYDLSNNYIYVGTDTDEEIKNNINITSGTGGGINISDGILNIYFGTDLLKYNLIRVNSTTYNLGENYIYLGNNNQSDTDILSNINITNGTKKIENNQLVINYQEEDSNIREVVARIPIIKLNSSTYSFIDNYLYTHLKPFNENKITCTNAEMTYSNNILSITYQGNKIDDIPIISLNITSPLRVNEKDKLIYTREILTLSNFRSGLSWNKEDSAWEYHINHKETGEIYYSEDGVEEGATLKVYCNNNLIDTYTVQQRSDYIDYKENTSVEDTSNDNENILWNLPTNQTFDIFQNGQIDTNGNVSFTNKDGQSLTNTNKIKTGDQVLITFPDFQHCIILSVKGDITGKGLYNQEDVDLSYSALKKRTTLDRINFLAADLNKDGQHKINDVAKLYQYSKNKIESLED